MPAVAFSSEVATDSREENASEQKPQSRNLKRFLLVPAFLAGELDARLATLGLNAVRRTALAADRLDAGRTLLDDDVLLCHRLADPALRLFAHRLLGHFFFHPFPSCARAINSTCS